jgi:hypothetical protein
MPADIDISGIRLSKSDRKDLSGGVLGEDVYVQFLCTTESGHDPSEEPDDRVRPSHAAFHGRVFTLSDAPVPPLDYGCRCAIRYVAAPGSPASEIIDPADSEPTTPAKATEDWLIDNVPELDTLKRSAAAAKSKDALSTVAVKAKKIGVPEPRSIAQMIIDMLNGGL